MDIDLHDWLILAVIIVVIEIVGYAVLWHLFVDD
jgi:hypothetical protein